VDGLPSCASTQKDMIDGCADMNCVCTRCNIHWSDDTA
jgi:hypothetical protein